MISAVIMGFSLEALSTYHSIAWAHHDPATATGMSNREYMLMVEQAIAQSDVVVFNATDDNLSIDEVVILHTAYINRTPIIAVGLRALSPLLEEMVSQRFPELDFVVEHLMASYKLSKQS
ncbi:hypothetical protein RE628_17540 [Paenibacillus sp. D2_2]|uniref:hypothetical protein n=1 Tax=Paenibacillus sp. D2_2 TaxID=3073092 RepID=UPI002814C534|nr:hypothetical protein [Paenibacillus sp. D2_2]WMT39255.1 hypothetical protein RE628_17540 [Paenibacillus sp. D2_2]